MDVTLKVALLVQDYLMTYVGDAGNVANMLRIFRHGCISKGTHADMYI